MHAPTISRIFAVVACIGLGTASAAISELVYSGPDGLVYAGYANQGQANAVNTIPDFSGAGYGGGGVPIPFIPASVTLTDDGPADDTARIQYAINVVSAAPIGADGFRGAVRLEAGDYTVANTLRIAKSGVVIRGAGSQKNGGTRITYTSTNKSNLFEVDGSGGPSEIGGTRVGITDVFVPVGATSFQVSNASGFAPGDQIIVQNTVNQKWLDDLSNMSQWGWSTSGYQLRFRRTVTAVSGNQITIDIPIVQTIEDQYGGGDIYKYSFSGELSKVGFEALRLESTFLGPGDEQHGWTAIRMDQLRDGWVRQVTGLYFGYGLVTIDSNSSQITVEDSAMLDHQSMISGARRYSFSIDDSQQLLIQRCLTREGRHDYVSGSRTPGPNVFVDSRADNPHADIGPHHRYATGQLYDNIMGGAMTANNHRGGGSGHGWAGAQILYWNAHASSLRVDAPNGAMNWSIGSVGAKIADGGGEPFGIWESHNVPVTPRSLYYTQLSERLGINALNSVVLPAQKVGTIWEELHEWGGDGVFLDKLIALADETTIPQAGQALAIRGIVRDLAMLDRGADVLWRKLYGPGTASFDDATALETTVSFTQDGIYQLELSLDDGASIIRALVTTQVGTGGSDSTPPAAPLDLRAEAGSSSITLDWASSTESDFAGYNVYRSTTPGADGEALAYGLPVGQFTDQTTEKGVRYFYTVRAVDTNSNASIPSAEASAMVNALPTLQFVDPRDGSIYNNGDSLSVAVEASDRGGFIAGVTLFLNGQLVREESSAPFEWGPQSDSLLNNLALGSYVLRAVATDNQGASSEASIGFTVGVNKPPAAPTGLTAIASYGWVALDWDDSAELDLAGYRIYRSTSPDSSGTTVAISADSRIDDVGLVGGTTYYYRVTAVDIEGLESPVSSQQSTTPAIVPSGMTVFGSNNEGQGGFTQSYGSGSVIWSTQIGSVRYRNQNTGMQNASLLKAFSLDRSDGQSYTIEGVITLTEGYAEDNNRVGLYLFGDSARVPNEDEVGAICILINFESGSFSIMQGIDRNTLQSSNHGRAKDFSWFGSEIRIEVEMTFNGGNIDLVATLTDSLNNVTRVSHSVFASSYTGDYFGFATRSRTRDFGVEGAIKSAPFTMDYQSFRLSSPFTPPAAPTGLVASAGANLVSLDWNDNTESDLDSYRIYRSETSGEYDDNLSINLTSSDTVDYLASDDRIYYYVVTAVDRDGNESEWSEEAFAIPAASNNGSPAFISDLIVETEAEGLAAYSSTIADNAIDPESDPMLFSLISGPAWLSVETDGGLSGTPGLNDVGVNTFIVSVTAAGGSDTAVLEIMVNGVSQSVLAGLWYGTVPGDINLSAANPKTEILVDPSIRTEGAIPLNTTAIYSGQIYDADGRISFTESIDDRARIYIDGSLVLSSNVWNNRISTGNLNLAPGWHNIEIRISNGGGPGGPYSSPGIGFDPAGGSEWQLLTDPGNASLLRWANPPLAEAGADQDVIDSDLDGSESVLLDASGSSDADGTIVSYVWSDGSTQVASGAKFQVALPIGEHSFSLTVTDDDGASGSDTVTVRINAGVSSDSDGDGMLDADELLAGSDPDDPGSVFGIELIEPSTGTVAFQIPTAVGSHYRVFYSDTLAPSSWEPLAGHESVLGDGNTLRIEDNPSDKRFYKIEVRSTAW